MAGAPDQGHTPCHPHRKPCAIAFPNVTQRISRWRYHIHRTAGHPPFLCTTKTVAPLPGRLDARFRAHQSPHTSLHDGEDTEKITCRPGVRDQCLWACRRWCPVDRPSG